jgi:ssDNA-binding Zn-finger/Zn-ribbon topoisomerase 1
MDRRKLRDDYVKLFGKVKEEGLQQCPKCNKQSLKVKVPEGQSTFTRCIGVVTLNKKQVNIIFKRNSMGILTQDGSYLAAL